MSSRSSCSPLPIVTADEGANEASRAAARRSLSFGLVAWWLVLGGFAPAWLAPWGLSQAAATEPALVTIAVAPEATGASSCLSVACHGGGGLVARGPSGRSAISRSAGRVWRQDDPHARAADTLEGPRYRAILDRLAPPPAPTPDTDAKDDGEAATVASRRAELARRCAACHDPVGLAAGAGATAAQEKAPDAASFVGQSHGIDCATCHGSAERWLTRHFERDASPDELKTLGMHDLKHAFERAELCARCHVGDSRHDLHHDMLAAGHPPLRYEFASYHARLPQHWRGPADALAQRRESLALWTAGQLASAAVALELTASRAAAASRPAEADAASPWPELAEYDCLACHQRLRPAIGPAPRASRAAPLVGLPAWSRWHHRLAIPLAERLDRRAASSAESPATPRNMAAELRELAARLDQPATASLPDIARSASFLSDELRRIGARAPRLGVARPDGAPRSIPQLFAFEPTLADLLDVAAAEVSVASDWEALCQVALALEVGRRATLRGAADHDDSRRGELQRDLRRIRASLAFGVRDEAGRRREVDWPRVRDEGTDGERLVADERSWTDWESLVGAFARPLRTLRERESIE